MPSSTQLLVAAGFGLRLQEQDPDDFFEDDLLLKGFAMDLMWFYDEVPEEYQDFRQKAQVLEKEHLEIRTALQEARAALRADPENPSLKTRVAELEAKLTDLDKRAPWISQGIPLEVLLWGVPH
jgi:hypothetical protein